MLAIAGNANLELARFNRELQTYVRLSGKLPEDAAQKQAGEFSYRLLLELKNLKPGKGTIRAQAFALLNTNRGVKVRPAVRQRILTKYSAASSLATRRLALSRRGQNIQHAIAARKFIGPTKKNRIANVQAEAVKAEINLRERAGGFLAISSRFPDVSDRVDEAYSHSFYTQTLGGRFITPSPNAAEARFQWGKFGPQSAGAALGLSKPRGAAAIAAALRATRENQLEYIRRKQREALGRLR